MVISVLEKNFIFSRSLSSYFLSDGALPKQDLTFALGGSDFVKQALAVLHFSDRW